MNRLSKLGWQTIQTAGVRVFIALLIFVTTAVIARFLGPEGQGVYFATITLATIIVQFSILGLQSSNAYLLAQNQRLLRGLLTNSLLVSVVFGTIVALTVTLAVIAGGWKIGATSVCLWLGALMVPARMFFMLGSNLLVGMQRITTFNAVQIVLYVLVLAAVILVSAMHVSVVTFLVVTLIAWTLAATLLLVVLARSDGLSRNFDAEIFRSGLRYGMKSHIACLFGFLVLRVNVFVLQAYHGDHAVGHYSVAAQIWEAMLFLPQSLALVVFPTLVQAKDRRWILTLKNLLAITACMSLACALCALTVRPFVHLAFGEDFLPAVAVMWWMLPGVFAFSLISVVSKYLASTGFPRLQVVTWIAAFGLITVLGAVLIPRYSGVGAAMALSITSCATLAMLFSIAYWISHQESPQQMTLSTAKFANVGMTPSVARP